MCTLFVDEQHITMYDALYCPLYTLRGRVTMTCHKVDVCLYFKFMWDKCTKYVRHLLLIIITIQVIVSDHLNKAIPEQKVNCFIT